MRVIVTFKYNLFEWRNQHFITQAINCLCSLKAFPNGNSAPQPLYISIPRNRMSLKAFIHIVDSSLSSMHFCDISSDNSFVQKSDGPTPFLTQKHMEKINWNPKIPRVWVRDNEDVLWEFEPPIKHHKLFRHSGESCFHHHLASSLLHLTCWMLYYVLYFSPSKWS